MPLSKLNSSALDLTGEPLNAGIISSVDDISSTAMVKAGTGMSADTYAQNYSSGFMTTGACSTQNARHIYSWYSVYTGGSTSYVHLRTSLWGGGAPSGNTQYIMGGFHIHGYYYTVGQCDQWITFHNWSGSTNAGYTKVTTGSWNADTAAYVDTTGYVTIRLPSAQYIAYCIDLHQYPIYAVRDIRVTSRIDSSAATI